MKKSDTSDNIIREIFENHDSIAVVGMSTNKGKPAHGVPGFMHTKGYSVIPVNPFAESILSRKSHPDLASVPDDIDIVEVFRPSEQALDVVKEALVRNGERGDIRVIWLQEGIVNEEARRLAEAAGVIFIQDKCMYKEFVRLFPER